MPSKKQSYKEAFLNFGFTSVIENSVEKPQCVVCSKVLARESMKPSKLKQHLESRHGELVRKSADYFRRKSKLLKNCRLDSGGMWAKQSSIGGVVSHRFPHCSGKKASHNWRGTRKALPH